MGLNDWTSLFFFFCKHLPQFSHSWAGSPPGLPQYSPSGAWLSAALWRISTISPALAVKVICVHTRLCFAGYISRCQTDGWRLLSVTFVLAVLPQAKHLLAWTHSHSEAMIEKLQFKWRITLHDWMQFTSWLKTVKQAGTMMYCDGLQMSVEMKLWHCWVQPNPTLWQKLIVSCSFLSWPLFGCHSPHAVNLVCWWSLSNAAQRTTQLSVTQWVLLCYQICQIWFEGSFRHVISQKHLWHV